VISPSPSHGGPWTVASFAVDGSDAEGVSSA
jgi:hypothetical protein